MSEKTTDKNKLDTKVYSFEELLNEKGCFVYTAVGISMLPFLRRRRDVIEIQKKGPERLKKYDVVLYKRRDRYILHRILKVLPDGYLIAGDNCTAVERDIKDENILGVMTRVKRNGKILTLDNPLYKMYVHLWCDCYPVRMFLLKVKHSIGRVYYGIKRLIKCENK